MQNELNLENLLIKGAEEFGLDLDEQQLKSLIKYKDMLKEWNEKINLTSIEEDGDIIIKHYIDSFSIIPYLKNEKIKLIDIGTGAGFPGLPIKIAYPHVHVTLLDSLGKRVNFLNEIINSLNLNEIEAIHGRAEDYGINMDFREKYDISVARAVASLPVLLEYCLPYTKTGGIFIAMKGSSTEEISSSKKALEILGGEIEEVKDIILPSSDIKRNIIIVRKFRQTSTKYPRKAGKPSKEPLV